MPPLADLQIASKIIQSFKSAKSLKNLSRYHKHQTRLLSEIFSEMEEKHLSTLVQSEAFLGNIKAINRDIQKLERTLRGGPLVVWFQFQESQQELAEIQLALAGWKVAKKNNTKKGGNDAAENNEAKLQKGREDLIKQTKEKVNKRIKDARAKDDSKLREEVEDLLKKFRSNKRRMWQQSPVHHLDDLFPGLQNLSRNDHDYRMFVFQSFLNKFTTNSSNLVSTLINELNTYVDAQLDSIQGGRPPTPPIQLQVVRKPSGTIVTVLLGSKTRTDIRTHYFGDVEHESKLPVLYTASSHSDTQGEFVVAQQAIRNRPDSHIYLVENSTGDPFILATLLGPDIMSDVVKSLPRDPGMAVKDAICPPTEHPWITEDGWKAYGMHQLQCNSRRLQDYSHQIFVPGPPASKPGQ
ncbi:hypothetical protein MVEN_02446100 [Mycena venus]|uniref:Uncharacterized protein n=1 Tax=Mycena venus TaxID=2733690 RepID=A0A8H6WYL8_9AGAR|nr:hypothetical protein MVEN_02446100 [Mycena venus]